MSEGGAVNGSTVLYLEGAQVAERVAEVEERAENSENGDEVRN